MAGIGSTEDPSLLHGARDPAASGARPCRWARTAEAVESAAGVWPDPRTDPSRV